MSGKKTKPSKRSPKSFDTPEEQKPAVEFVAGMTGGTGTDTQVEIPSASFTVARDLRKHEREEEYSGSFTLGKMPDVTYPLDPAEPFHREPETVEPVEEPLDNDYLRTLAFFEEPVTVRFERANAKFPSPVVPCTINGRGPEVLMNGHWINMSGFFPVGQVLTTKRKYLDQIGRARIDTIQTEVSEEYSEHPVNSVVRSPSLRANFTVIEDKSPQGHEWLSRLFAMVT